MVPPTQLSKTIEVELSKYRKSSIGVSELSGHYRTSIGKVLSNYRAGAQVVDYPFDPLAYRGWAELGQKHEFNRSSLRETVFNPPLYSTSYMIISSCIKQSYTPRKALHRQHVLWPIEYFARHDGTRHHVGDACRGQTSGKLSTARVDVADTSFQSSRARP